MGGKWENVVSSFPHIPIKPFPCYFPFPRNQSSTSHLPWDFHGSRGSHENYRYELISTPTRPTFTLLLPNIEFVLASEDGTEVKSARDGFIDRLATEDNDGLR